MLLHILTQKGKGYAPALKQPDKFHGLGKYKIESGETAPTPTPTYSEIFGKTLAKFAIESEARCYYCGDAKRDWSFAFR